MLRVKSKIDSSSFSVANRLIRVFWALFYTILFRFSPISIFRWRILILKIFGCQVEWNSRVYPSAKIWLPSNLVVGKNSTIGPGVNVYNQGLITIGQEVIISQGSHLCASTHDYNDPLHPLVLKPIVIEDHVWVCADAFVGPGVTLAQGTVVGARAAIFKNSQPWSVYSGNPAQLIKQRENFKRG